MLKRILILTGVVVFSLTVLSGLLEHLSGAAPAVRAGPELQGGCTPVTADITTTRTWSGACYHVMTSTVVIQPDVILTISPITSTRVEFESGSVLLVLGRLQSLGASDRPITLTSAISTTRCAWNGIVLPFASQGARIERSTIEYACTGVNIGGPQNIQIVSNVFRHLGEDAAKGAAISGITDYSLITGNVIYRSTNGIVLNKAFNNQVVGNTIYDVDQYGINFTAQLTTGLPTLGGDNNFVAYNLISNTATALRLENGSSNQVMSNSIYLNRSSAIYLAGQGSASVQYNYIYGNGGETGYPAAIYITGTPNMATNSIFSNTVYDERKDAIEYTASNGDTAPRIGGNALCSVPTFELQNGSSVNINASTNWWGTNMPMLGKEFTGSVNITPWITLSLIPSTATLPADGASTSIITISLRDTAGHTVPPASPRQTNPPPPNPRRIDLATTMGVISPAIAFVGDDGLATVMLTSDRKTGTGIITATAFCNYPISVPVRFAATNLAITKTTAMTHVVPGGAVAYRVTYSNTSSITASNVRITDTLPAGTTWMSDTAEALGWTRVQTSPQVIYTKPSLPPGALESFALTATVANGTCGYSLTNRVVIGTPTVQVTDTDNTAASSTVANMCPVDLVVVKDDDVGPTTPRSASLTPDRQAAVNQLLLGPQAVTQHRDFVYEGDLVTYTIAVVNVGTVTATNTVLTETLPQYTTFVTGSGWLAVTSITYTLQIGSLPPGDGRIYYFIVRVNDPIVADVSSLVNRVCGLAAESDDNPADNCSYEDTPVKRQPLRISKSAQCVIPGKNFDYWITYTNTMPATYSNVRITDTLPISATYMGDVGDWNCPGNLYCYWIAPAVYPGSTNVRPLSIRLDRTYPYATATNTVVISDSKPFTLVTTVDRRPDLAVVKNDNIGPLPLAQRQAWEQIEQQIYGDVRISRVQDNREYARPGERITYTILYVNNGVTPATNVVLTETLPANTTYVGGGWLPAGGQFYTVSLGTLDPQQGGQREFIVQVNNPFPCGANRVVNQINIGGNQSECDLSNNWSADHTPITGCTWLKVFLPIVLKNYPAIPLEVMFSSSTYRVWENAGAATITVVLSKPSVETVTVNLVASDGTATPGVDYQPVSTTLVFTPSQTSVDVPIRIFTDTIAESPETVILMLSRPVNAVLGQPNPATLTIMDICPPTPPNCAPAVWCTIPSESGPVGMAYDTVNSRLFVANQGNGSNPSNLTIFTPFGTPLHTLDLPGAQGVALDSTRNRAYVAGGNSLYVVDVSGVTPSVLATVDVGIGGDVGAHSVAFNPNTDLIYVTGYNDNSVTVVSGATWAVLRRMTGFHEPSYTVVNTVTNKVYVSNHTGGNPWGRVTVISGTNRITEVYLSGDLYGISADNVRNRIYVASISVARVYVIDGKTDTTMGDIQIVRARDARPVPLRMTVVNPNVISGTHLWLTSSQGDFWGMDRLILLNLPGSEWPPQTPLVLRSTSVDASPEGGLVFDPAPASWRVFASSTASNLVTISQDKTALCPTPLTAGTAGDEDYYAVAHDYAYHKPGR